MLVDPRIGDRIVRAGAAGGDRRPQTIRFYRVNGKIHGLYRFWKGQGDLKSETHYEHGNRLDEQGDLALSCPNPENQ
jgi:hypothetical protein